MRMGPSSLRQSIRIELENIFTWVGKTYGRGTLAGFAKQTENITSSRQGRPPVVVMSRSGPSAPRPLPQPHGKRPKKRNLQLTIVEDHNEVNHRSKYYPKRSHNFFFVINHCHNKPQPFVVMAPYQTTAILIVVLILAVVLIRNFLIPKNNPLKQSNK